jgi:ArsR family transcriptional regulator
MDANASPDRLLRWMESLSDSTRLRILRLIERHELGVAELADVLQLPQSTISRHIKSLSESDWLRTRRVGTSHLSTIDESTLDAAQKRLWHIAREQTAGWPTLEQDDARLDRLLRDRRDTTRRFFTGAAGDWDRIRKQMYGERFSWEVLPALLSPESMVADLGCGTGKMIERIAPYVARVIGVDNTPAMLEAARHRTSGLANVEVRSGDLEALPIDDQSIDAATLVLALSYVAEPLAVLGEMRRVLRPHGRAVVVDAMRYDREDFRRESGAVRPGFSSDELVELLSAAGFSRVVLRPLPTEPDARGPALVVASASA